MSTTGGEGPPAEWRPPPTWAPPPAVPPPPVPPPPTPQPWTPREDTRIVRLEPTTRASLVWETRVVMVAFLWPAVTGAAVALAEHVNGVGPVTRFPVLLPDNPVGNLIIGIFAYLPVAAVVPLALYLLNRTGQPPRSLGLLRPRLGLDAWPALGLIGASLGCEFVLAAVLLPIIRHSSLYDKTVVGHLPAYYVVYGLAISATTAVAEEVLVNGYLLTRLGQLGWSPQRALVLSLILRTSYHAYYGVGFILTVPFGYFVTRSFQKHGRLTRPIVTHFMFDAILITIAILA